MPARVTSLLLHESRAATGEVGQLAAVSEQLVVAPAAADVLLATADVIATDGHHLEHQQRMLVAQ